MIYISSPSTSSNLVQVWPFYFGDTIHRDIFLQYNDLGNDWWVVQKFEHMGIYDVHEKNGDVHQADYYSDT